MNVKLKVGRKYLTRAGEVVICDRAITPGTRGFEGYSFWMRQKNGGCFVVTEDGYTGSPPTPHPCDIVSEHHATEPEATPTEQPETLRDRFAMAALAGALAGRLSLPNELLAKHVLAIATAMMEARKK